MRGLAAGSLIRDIMAHQLATVTAVVRKQAEFLQQLEGQYPGITRVQTDHVGRLVI